MSRIRANQITNQSADGAPTVQNGLVISGVTTSTTFSGSGASLTNLPAQATIANNADNRVITGGSGVNLNGEANLTFNSSLVVTDGNGTVTTGGNYINLKRTSATVNYINAPLADAELHISADENIIFKTVHTGDFNSTERLRITSDGKMGLGIASPTGQFAVSDGTRIAEINPHSSGTFIGNRSNHDVLFQVNAATKAKIDTNGHLTISDGNLVIGTAGKGIDFGSSTHASGMSDEILTDYEEGSWTPVFATAGSGGSTVSNPSNTQATYVKVGRIVYLHLGVHGLTKNWAGSSTEVFIRGIPYRSYFQHSGHPVRHGYWGASDDDLNVYAQIDQYQTYMSLQKGGGAQGRYEPLYWSDMHWEGYGNLTMEITYETDQGV